MFTDFDGLNFKFEDSVGINRLLLDKSICCNSSCVCSSQSTVKFRFSLFLVIFFNFALQLKVQALQTFIYQVAEIFSSNDFPQFQLSCNEIQNETIDVTQKLQDDLIEAIEHNSFIYLNDNFKILLDLKFNLITNEENSTDLKTLASVDKHGVKLIGASQLQNPERYYRIGVTEAVPYTTYKRDPSTNQILLDKNGQPVYQGYCIDFIDVLSRKMNFSYDLVEPMDGGKFGMRKADGSFDGLVGDLVRGETDFVIAALKMNAEREEVIDFVAPYFDQTGEIYPNFT